VAEGETVDVERLGGDVGATVTLEEVLLVSGEDDEQARIGTPVVEQAQVTAEIVKQGLDKKIIVFKKKRRKGYKRKQGHRQRQTTLRIVEIQA
jgi:large subunit ribosomal protein L21